MELPIRQRESKKNIYSFYSLKISSFTTFAGLPATIVSGGTFLVTTDPAHTIERSPIVTHFMIIARLPIHTSSPITIGAIHTSRSLSTN